MKSLNELLRIGLATREQGLATSCFGMTFLQAKSQPS